MGQYAGQHTGYLRNRSSPRQLTYGWGAVTGTQMWGTVLVEATLMQIPCYVEERCAHRASKLAEPHSKAACSTCSTLHYLSKAACSTLQQLVVLVGAFHQLITSSV
jgi:hypothetical protein